MCAGLHSYPTVANSITRTEVAENKLQAPINGCKVTKPRTFASSRLASV